MKPIQATGLAAVLCFISLAQATEETIVPPALVVKAAEVKTITAQRWEFSSVEIQSGGELRVQRNSTEPLRLIVSGPMLLHGAITYGDADSSERTITVRGENGQPLELKFTHSNKGGDGAGGVASHHTAPGGGGASGSNAFGGGGGEGASYWADALGQGWLRGADATGYRGAASYQRCGFAGGNGAERGAYDAGGVIVLEVSGQFDGTGGALVARGRNGRDGAPGRPGAQTGGVGSYGCFNRPSGGGGGAPGGHGGYVVAHLKGGVVEYPSVDLAGGRGGKGGNATSTPVGSNGQAGRTNSAYWFVTP